MLNSDNFCGRCFRVDILVYWVYWGRIVNDNLLKIYYEFYLYNGYLFFGDLVVSRVNC